MECPKHRKYDREKARDVVAGMPRRRRVEKDLELGRAFWGMAISKLHLHQYSTVHHATWYLGLGNELL